MKLLPLLVACFACNQVLGVQKTRLSDAFSDDVDGDGIANEHDNCPTVYNPDQKDTDHDGFGDACDFCPMLATTVNHDEDGDGVGDECDDCPEFPNFQLDTDGDGIGDACEPPVTPGQRVLFDPFLAIDSTIWDAHDAVKWISTGDAAEPGSAPQPTTALVANRMVTATVWQIAARFVSRRQWSDGDRFGVMLLSVASGTELGECIVECSGSSCMISNDYGGSTPQGATIAPAPIVRVKVLVVPFEAGTYYFACTTDDAGAAPLNAMILPPFEAFYPALVAMPDISVASIDVLQTM